MLRFLSLLTLAAIQSQAGAIQPHFIAGRSGDMPIVVVIGGPAIEKEVKTYSGLFNLYTIQLTNPGRAPLVFPPTGTAYRENGQAHFLWRWLGLHAPDLVLIVGDDDFGLAAALAENSVAGFGAIPARRIAPGNIVRTIPARIAKSEARIEHDRRLARTPHQVAVELSGIYGHDFDPPVYIPAMALISRLRLGQQADVAAIVSPYIDGRKDSLLKPSSSHLAGHLLFAELAERTSDQRYIDRVRAAADLQFKDWNEMSDGVFMGCPIMASAGKLTGKSSYFDMAAAHLQYMQKLCLREDGLYRHSPLNEAAWGRGNAFPALGLSWTLQNMPETHPAYANMVRDFKAHMATLAKFQDSDGMWHEVIDDPSSYAEFSATAMIATAMLRGVSRHWLDHGYLDNINAAWRAILVHIGPNGSLLDVCESTGKQKSLEDYLNRAASFGKDTRGGGMAMLFATELEAAGLPAVHE